MTVNNNLKADVKQATKDNIIANCTYIAVGTGTTTPAADDTILEAEVLRKAIQEYVENTNNVIVSGRLAATEANGNDLAEFGLLNASSAGDLQSHDIHIQFTKSSSVEVWYDNQFDIQVVINE